MPVKEVTCIVCGNVVSKRKSLAFGEGRACREHEEVVQMIEGKAQEELDKKLMASADEMMRVITLTSFVRVTHSLHGVPLVVLLAKVRQTYGKDVEKKVMDSIEEQGGATIDPIDMAASLMAYGNLAKRV